MKPQYAITALGVEAGIRIGNKLVSIGREMH